MTPDAFRSAYARLLGDHGLAPPPARGKRATHRSYGGSTRSDDGAEVFLVWCADQDVDPVRWVVARHEAVAWKHRIPITRLKSPKFLITFRAWGDRKQAASAGQDAVALATVINHRPSRWRAAKLRAVLSAEDCRNESLLSGATWYEPGSRSCAICPLAGECRG